MSRTETEDLRSQLNSVMHAYDKLDELYSAAQSREDKLLSQLQSLLLENERLKTEITTLQPVHNQRGAGRKKNNEQWTASYVSFCHLYQQACTMESIMEQMSISRATYYRYRKIYLEKGMLY